MFSNRKLNEASAVLNRANKVFEFELERALREECAQAQSEMKEVPAWTGDWLTYAQALNAAGGKVDIAHCQEWASKISDEIEQSFDISEDE